MDRRGFLRTGVRTGVLGTAALAFGPAFWRAAYAEPARPGPGPYGGLAAPDANGLRLPEGFRSRVVARTGEVVEGTRYTWHPNPDGGAVFATDDGGWIYASNSESVPPDGGASAIAFSADGRVAGAQRILGDTVANCAGGPTPWGTWLSCEEFDGGRVWECDPSGRTEAAVRPGLGTFAHEAVAVDPDGRALYLTEDRPDGRFYRFTPASWPDLDDGELEVAQVDEGRVAWVPVEADERASQQEAAADTTPFDGGEGCWYDRGSVYFTTKGDNRVWSLAVAADGGPDRLEVIYDGDRSPDAPLRGVDNVVVSPAGDLFVAEDGDDMQLVIISRSRTASPRQVAPFLQVVGYEGSEITGPAFSPLGDRLYLSSQRGPDGGVTFEVEGPFRRYKPGPRIGRKVPG